MNSTAALAVAETGARRLTIPVICGPTASGKSAIAMWLAGRHTLTIISADSRQVYRGFDVGTAKPGADEQRRVPHRGIDVAEPTERYSAADWSSLAQRAIGEAHGAGRLPVIVGGTGFYIATLFRPLFEEPPLDPDRRARMQAALEPASTDELRRWCAALDPARAHLGRAQLLRAIEVALLTGERLSQLHVARARPGVYQPSYLLVDPGMELSARIVSRAAAMLDGAWQDEVRHLGETVPEDAPAWNATGYEVTRSLVRGEIGLGEAQQKLVVETRQYAKRQRTWFRHQLERDRGAITRLVPDSPGWQETADEWLAGVSAQIRSSADQAADANDATSAGATGEGQAL